jgi:hypothetical protein
MGSFMYSCRAKDPTIPVTLNKLAGLQTKATEKVVQWCRHFLDYMATHTDATIWYYASDMVLNIHSDSLYLSAPNRLLLSRWSLPKPNQ